jgi:hypothetical protein
MSNQPMPVEPLALETVVGGTGVTTRTNTTSTTTDTDQLLKTLTSLSNTIKDIGNAANKSGFSTTDFLMLGLLMSQNRQVNVFVRRPFW